MISLIELLKKEGNIDDFGAIEEKIKQIKEKQIQQLLETDDETCFLVESSFRLIKKGEESDNKTIDPDLLRQFFLNDLCKALEDKGIDTTKLEVRDGITFRSHQRLKNILERAKHEAEQEARKSRDYTCFNTEYNRRVDSYVARELFPETEKDVCKVAEAQLANNLKKASESDHTDELKEYCNMCASKTKNFIRTQPQRHENAAIAGTSLLDMALALAIDETLREKPTKTIIVCAGIMHCTEMENEVMPILKFTKTSKKVESWRRFRILQGKASKAIQFSKIDSDWGKEKMLELLSEFEKDLDLPDQEPDQTDDGIESGS